MEETDPRDKATAKLDRLRLVLKQERWNFRLGYNSFDGISEGICIMMGIFPENSMVTESEFGPVFLPNGLEQLGFSERPSADEVPQLRQLINQECDRLLSVGASKSKRPRDALKIFNRYDITPPWLDVASSDKECAVHVPIKMIKDRAMQEWVRKELKVKAGIERAAREATTRCIRDLCKPVYLELRDQGFPGCRAESSNAVMKTKVARKILEKVKDTHPAVVTPQEKALIKNIRRWDGE